MAPFVSTTEIIFPSFRAQKKQSKDRQPREAKEERGALYTTTKATHPRHLAGFLVHIAGAVIVLSGFKMFSPLAIFTSFLQRTMFPIYNIHLASMSPYVHRS
jgi:hypothetical protein